MLWVLDTPLPSPRDPFAGPGGMQSPEAGAARGWAETLNSPQSPGVQRLFLPGGHDCCTGCRCLAALVLRQFQVMGSSEELRLGGGGQGMVLVARFLDSTFGVLLSGPEATVTLRR